MTDNYYLSFNEYINVNDYKKFIKNIYEIEFDKNI